MKIKYDKKYDIKYIRIKKGSVAKTEKLREWLLLDRSQKGEVLGIEILDASKHQIGVSTIDTKFVGYFDIEPRSKSAEERSVDLKVPKDIFPQGFQKAFV